MFFINLETDRLLLKNISSEDRAFILQQFSNDQVNQYLYDAEPISSLEEADGIISYFLDPEPRAQHRWILQCKDSGVKIGTCGFHCWNRNTHRTDIGYDLQPDYWGHGYMAEALQSILLFAKEHMNLERIDAHIFNENERSVVLAKKMGFQLSGETRMYLFRNKEYLHDIYSLFLRP